MKRVASAIVLFAMAGSAWAKKPTLAVLEYRAGTRALGGIADRIAEIAGRQTSYEVSAPADARRQIATVDADLAKCQGDAGCVAGLGRRLAVDEVLLVGVSELGDVILGLQRVKVSNGSVVSRVAESLAPEESPDDAAIVGYLKRLLPPAAFKRYGVIRVRADVRGAEVLIGGQPRGETPIGDLKVPAPASYAVRVRKKGHEEWSARVSVPPDGVVEVVAKMPRAGRSRGATPWYGKWWVWATVGGAAVITTAVVVTATAGEDPTTAPGVLSGWNTNP